MKSAHSLKSPDRFWSPAIPLAALVFPLLVFLDIGAISAAFYWGSHSGQEQTALSWKNACFFGVVGPIVLSFCRVYSLQWQALSRVLGKLCAAVGLIVLLHLLLQYSFYNALTQLLAPAQLGISAVCMLVGCSFNQLLYRKLLQWGFVRSWGVQRVLLVGDTSLLERQAHFVLQGIQLMGSTQPSTQALSEALDRQNIDRVVLHAPQLPPEEINKLYQITAHYGAELWIQPDAHQLLTSRQQLDEMAGIPVIKLQRTPLHHPLHRLTKRSLDLLIASFSLLLLSPLMLLLALAVKWDSPGAVFYRQERISRHGKAFKMLKFRTMGVNSEQNGPVWAQSNDPRTTRVGRWLRRSSLDELPQLLNVLRGDMSFVGPRPERPHFVSRFEQEILDYPDRHLVKAGMTGWAQVNGWRGDTSIVERTRCDLYYIENWSILLDLRIIGRSFITVVRDFFEHRAY